MPNTTGKPSGWTLLATVAAWLIAAFCLGLCAAAIALWQTELSIRQRLPAMGYNEILELRDDAWRPFRVPLAWALTAMSVGTAAAGCLPGILVRRPMAWIPATIAAVASVGTLGYLVAMR